MMDRTQGRFRFSPRGRLLFLSGLLVAALGLLVAQRIWFSDEADHARLNRMSLDQLEKQAPASADPSLHYYLARRRLEVGDAVGAKEALDESLRLDPHFSRARATLGTLLLSSDEDQRALMELQQVIRDDPTGIDGYLGLALLYQRNEAWQKQEQAATMARLVATTLARQAATSEPSTKRLEMRARSPSPRGNGY